MDKPRIGVYVCWCGTNIAKMVDVEAVAEELKKVPNVVVSRTYKYMCSDPGQELVVSDIREQKLNRIVVSACSPRIHELTFRTALKEAGLNPYLLVMANIREHDAWVHTDRAEATQKAKELIIAGINRAGFNEALTERMVAVHPATLVIGGGVAGMAAALEIADAGKQVFLVEKSGRLGGRLAEVDKTFPRLDSADEMTLPMVKRVHAHTNISLFLNTTVPAITGYVGNFEATLNPGITNEKKLAFGNIIVATGLKPMDPAPVEGTGYGRLPDVITAAEFETMLRSGKIAKKDGATPRHVAIIHCVGSRTEKHHVYCSRTCCATALKYAAQVRTALPGTAVYELYTDMRAFSKGCEEFYAEVSRQGVMFLMFDPEKGFPVIKQASRADGCGMLISFDEKLSGRAVEVPADLVVLMTALEADDGAKKTAHTVGVSLDQNGFFIEKHPKLDPVATTTGGVYIAGAAQGPKDIPDAVCQARAAAARVLRNIIKGTVQVEANTARVTPMLCTGCRMCFPVCPYTAITLDEKKNVASINDALCQGCGTCIALCRSRAINLQGYTSGQMQAELTALLEEKAV